MKLGLSDRTITILLLVLAAFITVIAFTHHKNWKKVLLGAILL